MTEFLIKSTFLFNLIVVLVFPNVLLARVVLVYDSQHPQAETLSKHGLRCRVNRMLWNVTIGGRR